MPDDTEPEVQGTRDEAVRDRTPAIGATVRTALEPTLTDEITDRNGAIDKRTARFVTLLGFVPPDSDFRILPKLRQVFTLVLVLQLLATVCVIPVAATATTEAERSATSLHEGSVRDGRNDAERPVTDSSNVSTNRDGTLGARTTNASDCGPGGDKSTTTHANTGGNGSDGTATEHTTASGTDGNEPSNTRSPTTESSTKPSQRSGRTNVPGSDILPDINSPIIALIGVLCVIGGLAALAR